MINRTEREMPKNSIQKAERLSGTKRIDALFKGGESGFIYPFRYFVRTIPIEVGAERAEDSPNVVVLISVPKRYHKRANVRNLIKRRTKELYRTNKHALHNKVQERDVKLHVALIYSVKDVVEYKKTEDAVKKILTTISAHL